MRTYRRTFVKKALRDSAARNKESRDGIIWSVDVENKQCRVKIQGSDEQIIAHYPRNQKVIPTWLRIGNAVRISHREGVRGYIEVVGEGRAIPTPVAGSSLPDRGGLSDGIITGMVMTELVPPGLGIQVSNGTYRIDEVIYSFTGFGGGYIIMDDPAPMTMGEMPILMSGATYASTDAAPAAGYFRYDVFYIGIDGEVHYVKGTETTSNPVKPIVPNDHVLINYILRVGGDTVVTDNRIGIDWFTPKPTNLIVTFDEEFTWNGGDDYPEKDIRIDVVDQYGHAVSSSSGWILKVTKLLGIGQLWSLDTGYDPDEVSQQLINSSYYVFKYQRDQLGIEVNPILHVNLSSSPPLYVLALTNLLDEFGDPI